MVILRMRSSSEAKDLLKKVKKMTKYSEELEDILEDCMYEEEDDDADFREDEEPSSSARRGRRRYRKM